MPMIYGTVWKKIYRSAFYLIQKMKQVNYVYSLSRAGWHTPQWWSALICLLLYSMLILVVLSRGICESVHYIMQRSSPQPERFFLSGQESWYTACNTSQRPVDCIQCWKGVILLAWVCIVCNQREVKLWGQKGMHRGCNASHTQREWLDFQCLHGEQFIAIMVVYF